MARVIISNDSNEARVPTKDARFASIASHILGEDYHLNLVFTTPETIQRFNLTYRNKNEPTDILSFPLGATEGEIYICPEEARVEATRFDRPYDNFILFLFIHGCVHLKGYDHGATMERIEVEARKKFKV